MIERLRRDIVACAAAFLLLLSVVQPAMAQADELLDKPGPVLRVLSTGVLHLRGAAWRKEPRVPDLAAKAPDRVLDIVVSQVQQGVDWEANPEAVANEQAWAEARTYFAHRDDVAKNFVSQVETIDLIRGYAYVKMHSGAGQTAMQLSFAEVMERVIEDLDGPLLQLIVGRIAREEDLNEDQSTKLRQAMQEAMRDPNATKELLRVFIDLDQNDDFHARRPPIDQLRVADFRILQDAWEDFRLAEQRDLVKELLEGIRTGQATRIRQRLATMVLVDRQNQKPDLAQMMSLLHYPFIVSRRSSGGAEGTEIVIYVRDDESQNDAMFEYCDVYYFFLHSEAVDEIHIAAFVEDQGEQTQERLMTDNFKLHKCHYAKVSLRRARAGHASRSWHIADNPNALDAEKIDQFPIDQAMDASLKTVLRQAYRDAVRAGIGPTTPPACAFNWTLPSDPEPLPAAPPPGGGG